MKRLNEQSEQDKIKEICRLAKANQNLWLNKQKIDNFIKKLEIMINTNVSMHLIVAAYMELINANITNFFDILVSHSKFERSFLEKNRNIIVEKLALNEIEEDRNFITSEDFSKDAELTKLLKEKIENSTLKDYSKMSQYDLKKEVDKALDSKNYDTLKRISPYVKEEIVLNTIKNALNEGCGCGGTKKGPVFRPKPRIKVPTPIKKLNENKFYDMKNRDDEYLMKPINEQSEKYNVETIVKLAISNTNLWLDPIDFKSFQDEIMRMAKNHEPLENIIEFYREFIDSNINKFFDLFIRSNYGFDRSFLDDNRDEIIEKIVKAAAPSRQQYPEEAEDDIAKLNKQSEEKKKRVKTYDEMSQYELQKEVDKAIDAKDFKKLEEIRPYLKEGFVKAHVDEFLNEQFLMKPLFEATNVNMNIGSKKGGLQKHHITKSYEHKLSKDDMKKLIGKMLVKYQKDKYISNMNLWLTKNNFGDYQSNRWVRAAVDILFKKVGGTWEPINTGLSLDKLTDKAMNYWNTRLSK